MVSLAPAVQTAFAEDSASAFARLIKDRSVVFWVAWSQPDETIVSACEQIIRSGRLTATRVEDDLRISFGPREARVALTGEPEDRHATLLAINEVLSPDYEVRFVWESIGADVGAFLPLRVAEWQTLESQDAAVVTRRTLTLSPALNVFTELTPRMKPAEPEGRSPAPPPPWWKFWS